MTCPVTQQVAGSGCQPLPRPRPPSSTPQVGLSSGGPWPPSQPMRECSWELYQPSEQDSWGPEWWSHRFLFLGPRSFEDSVGTTAHGGLAAVREEGA